MKVRPWYWLTLIAHALWNFAIPALWVLGPLIATRHLGGPSAWGAIVGCFAVGSVTGGLVSLRVRLRRPLVAANLALALTALPVLALVQPLPTWAIGIAAVAGGLGLAFLNTVWISTMQQLIPDEVRSRVDSYDWLISLAVMPVGYALIGPAASRFGTTAALVGAAVLLGVPGCLTTLIPGIRAVRRTAEGTLVEPATQRPGPGRPRLAGRRLAVQAPLSGHPELPQVRDDRVTADEAQQLWPASSCRAELETGGGHRKLDEALA